MTDGETDIVAPATETSVEVVPEQQATAPVDTAEPETPEAEEAPKSFSQEEVDAMIAKRLARAERQWRRENQQQPPEAASAHDDGEPLSREEIIAQYEASKQQEELVSKWVDREEAAREKYDDFESVAYDKTLPVTDHMALAIQASDQGPDVLYWLGSNPKEAARIANLPPILQAKEIGKIEATLAANPPAKKTTSAPAPINPVTPKANGGAVYDTTDPRSIEKMSTSEWIAAEEARLRRKWEAAHR